MCRRVECAECKKPTYAGCGMHIEQVLGDVPKNKRCTCREQPPKKNASAPPTQSPSILRKLFGG